MSKYNVNYKRLALMLLPTLLRHRLMSAILYAAMSPIEALHARLLTLRENARYRLYHNGQVCYLRAALCDLFDPGQRRITITDTPATDTLWIYTRDKVYPHTVHRRGSEYAGIVWCRGVQADSGFVVHIPAELHDRKAQLEGAIDRYRLVTKQYAIVTL